MRRNVIVIVPNSILKNQLEAKYPLVSGSYLVWGDALPPKVTDIIIWARSETSASADYVEQLRNQLIAPDKPDCIRTVRSEHTFKTIYEQLA